MSGLEGIERYLKVHVAEVRGLEPEGGPRLHPFITISRQAGAGGHSLAGALLETFARQEDADLFEGWETFDHRLCEIVASDPRFTKSMDALLTEKYRSKAEHFFHQVLQPSIDQDILMGRVFHVVRAVASIGKAVIVGRAGSQVTKGMGPGLSFRLIAPEAVRVERMMELHGLNRRQARDEARKTDAHRARLLKNHFKVDIEDPAQYDAIWNTGSVTVEEIAEAAVAMLRERVAKWRSVRGVQA